MKLNRRNSQKALTRIEALVVIVATGLLFLSLLRAFLPMLAGKRSPTRAYCMNNLKLIGLGFQQWANDHNGMFPMGVSMTDGGTKDFILTGHVYLHFQVLSNELITPPYLWQFEGLS